MSFQRINGTDVDANHVGDNDMNTTDTKSNRGILALQITNDEGEIDDLEGWANEIQDLEGGDDDFMEMMEDKKAKKKKKGQRGCCYICYLVG